VPSCIIRGVILVTADISATPAQEVGTARPRQQVLVALCVAAVANGLVPAVFFSVMRLFGQVDLSHRVLVVAVVLIEYAIALLLVLLHANVGFASGYAVATAAIVTLGSAALTFITVAPAGWGWNVFRAEILALGGFAFAVLSNVAFFFASVRYARAIHPRLHLGGFFFGIAASLALLFLYAYILS